MNDNENKDKEFTKRSGNARNFATAVYIGGVVGVTMLFISFILLAFPADAYFTRFIMAAAGLMVGGSMLAFPYALHNWAVTKDHRKWTTILYYTEMAFIAVNTVVSFVSLLSKYSMIYATPPEWVVMYEPFSVVAIVYTIFAWGTVFLLDPEHKDFAQSQQSDSRYKEKIAKLREDFLDSVEGEQAVLAAAQRDIAERFRADRFTGDKKHFGKPAEIAVDPEKGFVPKEQSLLLVQLAEENARLKAEAGPKVQGQDKPQNPQI